MFRRILIPLDGSFRAERALPVAARIARATHGSLLLLRVANIQAQYGPYLYRSYPSSSPLFAQEILDTELAQAQYYLATIAQLESLVDLAVEWEACSGAIAQTILEYAHVHHVDLIVMCSHGRTGFTRWVLGSVARKIVRLNPVPVLLLRKGGPPTLDLHCGVIHPLRALVALDGSPWAEAAITPAAHLVAALAAPGKGALHLARIVSLSDMQCEHAYTQCDAVMREQVLREATTYLSAVAEKVRVGLAGELGLVVTWSVGVKEDVADALIGMSELGGEAGACDLMAIATHGGRGFHRWMMGNITARVLDGTKQPLLIVRPHTTSINHEEVIEEKVIL